MNYMLLVYRSELEAEEAAAREYYVPKDCEGLSERLEQSGHWVSGGILQPICSATSVRVREGKRLVTDGPFAETREQLAGFMVVEAQDLDEAIAIAAQHPVAQMGTIEIRPFQNLTH